MTRICIFGAGAIGGYVGAALHEAGAEVSLVARGPHLEAIRADGLGLEKDGKVTRYSLPASDTVMVHMGTNQAKSTFGCL